MASNGCYSPHTGFSCAAQHLAQYSPQTHPTQKVTRDKDMQTRSNTLHPHIAPPQAIHHLLPPPRSSIAAVPAPLAFAAEVNSSDGWASPAE